VPWFYAVAESRHDLQNPTSPDKIRLLGEALGLDASTRVLDVASGRAGPALILAREFGCHVVAVERAPEFVAAARERVAEAGLADLVELVEQDAATFDAGREQWDAALCLGASFVWGNVRDAVDALLPSVRPGGHVAVGEPYWRTLPLPDGVDDRGFVSFADTVARFEAPGLALTTVLASSDDDWDRYESLRWQALEDWLAAHPDDGEIRAEYERHRRGYVEQTRGLLGWAILAGRKR
jgi:predicted O-methyltransferase YrrM